MLQDIATRLAIPGLPEWTGLIILALIALFAVAFILMPFSVFGLKGRMEAMEAQLDDIQAEIRGLALRLPDSRGRPAVAEDWIEPPSAYRDPPMPRAQPPVPPPPARAEPKLGWPKR
jgi:hypothetical protein